VFHLPRKVFGPQEFVNPLGELRKTGIVFSAVDHTVIMDVMLSLKSSFAKQNRFSFGQDWSAVSPLCGGFVLSRQRQRHP
jgi:hypothetical protein